MGYISHPKLYAVYVREQNYYYWGRDTMVGIYLWPFCHNAENLKLNDKYMRLDFKNHKWPFVIVGKLGTREVTKFCAEFSKESRASSDLWLTAAADRWQTEYGVPNAKSIVANFIKECESPTEKKIVARRTT